MPKNATSAEHLEALETKESAPIAETISIPRLDIRTIDVKIVGDSSLVCNRWSEKAKKIMLDKQTGKASSGREKKDPKKDFQASLYSLGKGRYGFPTIAFKSAAVTACTSLGKAISKVAARQAFHIVGEFAVINGTPTMRDDMVRVGMGVADIRFRGEFKEWSTTLRVRYNARVLSAEQIVSLLDTAGFGVGVGEHRSEKNGSWGLFHVAKGKE